MLKVKSPIARVMKVLLSGHDNPPPDNHHSEDEERVF
jgi:hypothetical protein